MKQQYMLSVHGVEGSPPPSPSPEHGHRGPGPGRRDGTLVLLADQDRRLWDRGLVVEGQAIIRACLRRNQPGPYQIQAAINAVHSDAATAADTDWRQIVQLYDRRPGRPSRPRRPGRRERAGMPRWRARGAVAGS